jgi:hypothetical protein
MKMKLKFTPEESEVLEKSLGIYIDRCRLEFVEGNPYTSTAANRLRVASELARRLHRIVLDGEPKALREQIETLRLQHDTAWAEADAYRDRAANLEQAVEKARFDTAEALKKAAWRGPAWTKSSPSGEPVQTHYAGDEQ